MVSDTNGFHKSAPATSSAQPNAIAFEFGDPPPTFDDALEERKYLKERLALAYRVFAHLDLVEGASGHLTIRDPVRKDCFWVTPYGRPFALMTASDLLLVDHDGKVVDGGKPGRRFYNSAAFVIHAGIHKSRPNANAVCHSHSPYGKAFSILRKPLPIYTQDGCVFYNDVALYEKHGGVVLDAEESQRIVDALGDKKAAILAQHGLLTVGEYIESATSWFLMLENECRAALLVDAAVGGDPKRLPAQVDEEAQKFTYDASGFEIAGRFEAMPWFDLLEEQNNGAHKA